MPTEADAIASAVLEEFRKLPAKRKPAVRDNGLREWVPLSGIVVKGPNFLKCVALATGMKCLPASKLPQANGIALHDWHAEVLVMRAFNRFLLAECRRLAEDCTAQSHYLRRRSREELLDSASRDGVDGAAPWNAQPFAWREELTLHMYCSEAPCGDASMELIMSSQADATPWPIPVALSPSPSPSTRNLTPPPSSTNIDTFTSTPTPPRPGAGADAPPTNPLPGRGYFSRLGIVRRKPARGDAPPSSSKSCSDKLALRQCTSLLGSLAALLVSPHGAYLSALVLPRSQYSPAGCRRCFGAGGGCSDDAEGGVGILGGYGYGGGSGGGSTTDEGPGAVTGGGKEGREGKEAGELMGGSEGGEEGGEGRMWPVRDRVWHGTGYAFQPLRVEVTDCEFEFSRRALQFKMTAEGLTTTANDHSEVPEVKVVASNLAVAWTADGDVDEGLIGGVLQGRKAFDAKGASLTSRRRMWAAAAEVAAALGEESIARELARGTYDSVKEGPLLAGRRRVKAEVRSEALRGWLRNTGDGGFSL